MIRLLLIGPNFNGYLERLESEASKLVDVDRYITPQFGTDFNYLLKLLFLGYRILTKIFGEKNLSFLFSYIKSLHTEKFNVSEKIINSRYDAVLMIGGREYSENGLRALKKIIHGDKWILYKWDSEDRFSLKNLHKYFDEVYTFQRADAVGGVKYLPNYHFYKPQKQLITSTQFLCAIGIFSEARIRDFRRILRVYPRAFVFAWFYQKKSGGEIFTNNERLTMEDKDQAYQNASIIIDFSQRSQTGMSNRILEGLALGKDVITNNADALQLFPSEALDIGCEKLEYRIIPWKLAVESSSYSLVKQCYASNWIRTILGNTDVNELK